MGGGKVTTEKGVVVGNHEGRGCPSRQNRERNESWGVVEKMGLKLGL